MIIRSQDKGKITTDLNLQIFIVVGGTFEVMSNATGSIGSYSTKEKAIKVLDMIQDVYTQYGTLEDGLGNIHGVFNIPKCFQMPQDSEV